MTATIQSLIEIANIHALRLKKALFYIKKIQPITIEKLKNLSDEELGFSELLTSRFAKLQDLIGVKLFPQILILLQEDEDNSTNLDRLYRLEKIGILPSAKNWIEMRVTRNFITHEYPDDPQLMCENFEKTIKYAEYLLEYWLKLQTEISQL